MKQKGEQKDYYSDENNRETTRDQRWTVIILRDKAKLSWTQIASQTGLKRSTCKMIHQRYEMSGTPSNRKRSGQPCALSERNKKDLERFVISSARTRRLPWEEITAEMGFTCSWKIVRDAMISMGYHKRVPRKK